MSLYFWINIVSISIPLLVSFHPRIKLYNDWASLFLSIFIGMTPFVFWDYYFTVNNYWGFNPVYIDGFHLFELPFEELMFFICIPYACVFTHLALVELFPKVKLSIVAAKYITLFLILLFIVVLIFNFQKIYTLFDFGYSILVLITMYLFNKKLLSSFYLTFLVMLIPFLIVNGILTGTGIEGEVVWYNSNAIIGARVFTIPIEDFVYAFSMIGSTLLIFNYLKKVGLVKKDF